MNEKIKEYLRHKCDCNYWHIMRESDCTCGFDKLIAEPDNQGIQWKLVDDTPNNLKNRWGEYVLALEECNKKPDIVLIEQVFMNEGNEYMYWAEIALPEREG